MTRIDYYIVNAKDSAQRLLFACRVIEKAFRKGHRVYVHTEDEQTAGEMDQALWSFRSDSFIPHHRLDENSGPPTAVEIGANPPPGRHHDVLVNLSNQIPDFFSRFERVAEIVSQQPEVLKASRINYSFYRDRGYPLHNHDLRNH